MSIEGKLFNRIEEYGGKKYQHIGFEDSENKFGSLLESLVPETGATKKVKLIIEPLD
jgi:hypothetical protein